MCCATLSRIINYSTKTLSYVMQPQGRVDRNVDDWLAKILLQNFRLCTVVSTRSNRGFDVDQASASFRRGTIFID